MPRFPFLPAHRRALVLISSLLLAAACAIFWSCYTSAKPSAGGSDAAATTPADTSEDDAQSGTQILLGLARDAIHDGRLVAPAGSNAYEFYLSVLQLDPENRTARDALRESFPIASEEIERTINRKQLEEARREIELLREFDRNNFTLALLGGKLSAASNIVRKQHEAEAERIQQANALRLAAGS